MRRVLKISALVLALIAVAVLGFFGLAIWVFISLLPAAIIYFVALATAKKTPALQERSSESDHTKAA
jgi:hypothetical protein